MVSHPPTGSQGPLTPTYWISRVFDTYLLDLKGLSHPPTGSQGSLTPTYWIPRVFDTHLADLKGLWHPPTGSQTIFLSFLEHLYTTMGDKYQKTNRQKKKNFLSYSCFRRFTVRRFIKQLPLLSMVHLQYLLDFPKKTETLPYIRLRKTNDITVSLDGKLFTHGDQSSPDNVT